MGEETETEFICAWCDAEQGIQRQGSHGICPRHQMIELEKWRALKAGKKTRQGHEGATPYPDGSAVCQ